MQVPVVLRGWSDASTRALEDGQAQDMGKKSPVDTPIMVTERLDKG